MMGREVDACAAGRSSSPCFGRLFFLLRLGRAAFWLQKAKPKWLQLAGGMLPPRPINPPTATNSDAPPEPPKATRYSGQFAS